MRFPFLLFCSILILLACAMTGLAQIPASAGSESDSLFVQAQTALERGRLEGVDVLAPRQFRKAADAITEAESLRKRNREPDLIGVKLRIALEEMDNGQRTADSARVRLADALAARSAALGAGADSLGNDNWKRAEEAFRGLVRDFERSPSSLKDKDIQNVAGTYRVARLDALRVELLGPTRHLIHEAERRNGDRTVPTLMLRSHQAVSRTEADLAQENLDSARADADAALRAAQHALGMLAYVETAQKDKYPWQAALLPYDDLLLNIGSRLNSTLDMSHGGVQAGQTILPLVDAQQESLQAQVSADRQTIHSLEQSLSDAQTSLADAQSRIAELENRLKTAEGARTSAIEQLQKATTTTERAARARALFKPEEAAVLQDSSGNVVIRLLGLRFPPGGTNLDKTHSKLLDKVADAMALFPGASARVEGYTDSEGGEDVNQRISEVRARVVADYLADKLKLPPEKLPSVGYGESRPIASNNTAEGRARNRRIEVILILAR
jgi:OOP family OmpA-OmpF porin